MGGIPASRVTRKMLDAYKEQAAARSLQRLLHSRSPQLQPRRMFHTGDLVWVYYLSSKQNENDEWIKGTVVSGEKDTPIARQSSRGTPRRVAYNAVRFEPNCPLTSELDS